MLDSAQGIAVLNMCEAWGGSFAAHNTLGFMHADGIHPSDAGHSDIAWRLGRMLDLFS